MRGSASLAMPTHAAARLPAQYRQKVGLMAKLGDTLSGEPPDSFLAQRFLAIVVATRFVFERLSTSSA